MTRAGIDDIVIGRQNKAHTALDDARFLLEGGRSTQSVVNRTYYAMFYAALALLERIGRVPSKHSGVISLFDTEFVLRGSFSRQRSKDFHKAFELRQVSDYRVLDSVSPERAREILQKATTFVREVKEFLRA